MPTTDPIADFLTRVRNALMARHAQVKVPASNIIKSIANILHEEGYVDDVTEAQDTPQGSLQIKLRYCADRSAAITGIRRESRPGQRRYVPVTEIPRVKNGMGIAILSTSNGVMTGARARQSNVGGELICTVW
ncbi:MAG: 30S ribosomal protein S8 [Myxococcales bacterium]|nr:30S ribosomal protein S8 [Myxococcales bacterium]